MPTVLLTGIPRSGTTLVCAMLNEQPNTVALAEPLHIDPHGDAERALSEIEGFVNQTRQSLLRDRLAMSKHIDGAVPDNTVTQDPAGVALRPGVALRGEVLFNKPLTQDFCLVIKHPAMFSALADRLAPRYPFYAVIRDPLAVLASWQTVDMALSHGHMPMAEAFSPFLAARLALVDNVLARQVTLLEWLLTTYLALPKGHVLRYEDILADAGRELSALSGQNIPPRLQRQPYDPRSRYAGVDLHRLAEALRPLIPLAARFYPEIASWLDQVS